MNAIISKGDKTAHVQLPVERKQLAGALSYLGANHTSDYDLKYNEENKDGLKVSLECFGVVENAIAKALLVGFRFHTLNESLTLMGNLPYQNRREVENTIKVDGLDSYEQLNRMLTEAYPLQNLRASKSATHGFASKSDTQHMMTSQFRSGRGKTRKREISRDFSRFFDPEFSRSFIDPFCPFRCCVRTRTHEKGFFASS